MNISKINSLPIVQQGKKTIGHVCSNIGKKINNSNISDSIKNGIKKFEPTGANNSFLALAGLMILTVIIPRVKTAAKRNPDNKEATKDEITEILFRDCQTVAIVLFALKMMNSIIAGKASKIKGLPMTNKPYQKIFDNDAKGIKKITESAKEFISTPLDKLKKIGKNVVDTVNPIGGVKILNNEEFAQKYSGYKNIPEIKKLFSRIESEGGNKDKVFDKVIDSLIQKQENIITAEASKKAAGFEINTEKAKEVLEELKKLKKAGLKGLNDEKLDANIKEQLVGFFEDKNNALVMETKKLAAGLRTAALGIESIYLGFGLPALNQKRLEKKYLKNKDSFEMSEVQNQGTSGSLINKNVKTNEVKLYSNFLK